MSKRLADIDRNMFIATLARSCAFELFAVRLKNAIANAGSVAEIRAEEERLIRERTIQLRDIDNKFIGEYDHIRGAMYDDEE